MLSEARRDHSLTRLVLSLYGGWGEGVVTIEEVILVGLNSGIRLILEGCYGDHVVEGSYLPRYQSHAEWPLSKALASIAKKG